MRDLLGRAVAAAGLGRDLQQKRVADAVLDGVERRAIAIGLEAVAAFVVAHMQVQHGRAGREAIGGALRLARPA